MNTLYLLIVLLVLPLLAVGLWLVKTNREIKRENQEASERTVSQILESIGWESKQRWVSADEIEFVSIIDGLSPGQHKLWARVRVGKNKISVALEHSSDCEMVHINLANSIADCFKKRDIPAMVKSTSDRQPTPEEIYVPEPPRHSEFDGGANLTSAE